MQTTIWALTLFSPRSSIRMWLSSWPWSSWSCMKISSNGWSARITTRTCNKINNSFLKKHNFDVCRLDPDLPYGHRGHLRALWAAWPESSGSRWAGECVEWRGCQTAWTFPGSHWPLKAGVFKECKCIYSRRTLLTALRVVSSEPYSVTQLLKRAVCDGSTCFVQPYLPVVHVQNSWSSYCGESVSIASRRYFETDQFYYNRSSVKPSSLSFCLNAISSNILSSVASASGSLDLQIIRSE